MPRILVDEIDIDRAIELLERKTFFSGLSENDCVIGILRSIKFSGNSGIKDYRCSHCRRLLLKQVGPVLEIKCDRCDEVNGITL